MKEMGMRALVRLQGLHSLSLLTLSCGWLRLAPWLLPARARHCAAVAGHTNPRCHLALTGTGIWGFVFPLCALKGAAGQMAERCGARRVACPRRR